MLIVNIEEKLEKTLKKHKVENKADDRVEAQDDVKLPYLDTNGSDEAEVDNKTP